MSFRCVLTIVEYKGERLSPLCFKTEEECLDFGRVMFEPPQTVLEWRVEKTNKPAKFRFKDGKVRW